MQGNLTITGYANGLPSGGITVGPLQITSLTPVGEELSLLLTQGTNTIAIPAGTTAVVIVPPAGNAVGLTLKGIAGDTGLALAPSLPHQFCPAPGAASFVLSAALSMTAATQIVFL